MVFLSGWELYAMEVPGIVRNLAEIGTCEMLLR